MVTLVQMVLLVNKGHKVTKDQMDQTVRLENKVRMVAMDYQEETE